MPQTSICVRRFTAQQAHEIQSVLNIDGSSKTRLCMALMTEGNIASFSLGF